jgi:hypothetical protein
MKSFECTHPRREFGRVLHDRGEHILERCTDCHVNVRGPGRWVPRSEVRDPDALPVFQDLRTSAVRGGPAQRDLFGGQP